MCGETLNDDEEMMIMYLQITYIYFSVWYPGYLCSNINLKSLGPAQIALQVQIEMKIPYGVQISPTFDTQTLHWRLSIFCEK